MLKHEKYTEHKTVRLTKTQTDYLEQMGISIRDAIDYYIENNTNKLQKLKQRERYLLNKIPLLETELDKLKEELKEISEELGHTIDKEQLQIEVVTAGDRILQNCKVTHNGKTDKTTLGNYILSPACKQILNNYMFHERILYPLLIKFELPSFYLYSKKK